jgi:long-chain acyl-CoA synthetase
LLFGAAVVHQRTLRPQYLRTTMKKYGITHMALVPTILKNLEEKVRESLDELSDWQRRAIDGLTKLNEWVTAAKPRPTVSRMLLKPLHDGFGGKLRLIFAGGAFIDPNTARFFYDLGFPVVIGYGLTEASTVATVNTLDPFRPDTVGKPVPGVEIEIRDANDVGVGEVWIRGRTVMKGYLDAPELTAEALVDGWLRTGDLGLLDAAGHLKLLGRAKNMIVTEGGKNIYPEDIESNFEDLPDCEEFCVFAANYIWPTGKLTGEQLVIVVRPSDKGGASDALVAELRRRNRRLPDFKRLAGYVVCDDEFPATASLKIKRPQLAARLRDWDRTAAIVPLSE